MGRVVYAIREFKAGDLDQVININRLCLPENYAPYFFMENYKRFPHSFLVAEVLDRVVGYVMGRVENSYSLLKTFKNGHIISIAVLPNYRRMGIGESLIKSVEKSFKNYYGVHKLTLEVRVTNLPAISLYRKLGFRIKNKLMCYYQDGENAYLMEKLLT